MYLQSMDVPAGDGCTCSRLMYLQSMNVPAGDGCTCSRWIFLQALDVTAVALDVPAGNGCKGVMTHARCRSKIMVLSTLNVHH
jgi:glucose dehydrogenase